MNLRAWVEPREMKNVTLASYDNVYIIKMAFGHDKTTALFTLAAIVI